MPKLAALLLLAVIAWPTSSAFSAYDPCRQQYNLMTSAQRRVDQADRQVSRAQDTLLNRQNQVELRMVFYQAALERAWANVQAASTISNGYAAGCVIRSLFWGGYGCVSSSIYSGAVRRANANAAYNAAVGRRNSYYVYAQGLIRRQAEQVTHAQDQYNAEVANYQKFESDYRACQANPPCQSGASCH